MAKKKKESNKPISSKKAKKKIIKKRTVKKGPSEWSERCLLYTSPSPRDQRGSRMPSSA